MAIDYGKRRTGLAVTDDLQMIASGLTTVETKDLFVYLKRYFKENQVEEIVVGLPTDLRGELSSVEEDIQKFLKKFAQDFPHVKINRLDERYTSKLASFYISQSGKSRKERQNKGLIDKVSATLILQNFLDRK